MLEMLLSSLQMCKCACLKRKLYSVFQLSLKANKGLILDTFLFPHQDILGNNNNIQTEINHFISFNQLINLFEENLSSTNNNHTFYLLRSFLGTQGHQTAIKAQV